MNIRNLRDLKEQVDKLYTKYGPDTPVVHKADEGPVYTPITLWHVTPGTGGAPYEGLELDEDFIDAPEGDHILIDFDQHE